jgi:hypothetical protein
MSLFAIMAPVEHAALIASLQTHYPDNHLKVGPGQWLVAGAGTAVDVSNQLGITTGQSGLAIVCLIGGYYGRTANNIWEWMAAKGKTVAFPRDHATDLSRQRLQLHTSGSSGIAKICWAVAGSSWYVERAGQAA